MSIIKPTESDISIEIKLDKAVGVPIPNDEKLTYSDIVGREVKIGIFDKNANMFLHNTIRMRAFWK